MKTIKFVSNDLHQKKFTTALRKNVNDYFKENKISKKGNLAMYMQSIIMLAFYLIPFVIILTMSINNWVALLMVVLMGVGLAGIGMSVMHDAVHGSYSNKQWVNTFYGASMYLLGSNVLNWEIQHNLLHHSYTNVDGYDQDIASKGPIRLCEHAPLHKIHKYQYIHAFFFYGLMTIVKLTKDFTQLLYFYKVKLVKSSLNIMYEFLKMVFVKIMYLVIFIGLPIILTPFSWWQVIFGFFIMHWLAGCILSTVFQMAHVVEGTKQPLPNKDGIIHTTWMVHQLNTTSDFARDNLFLNWYVGGLNFQIEHHLFPNICHVHYRKIAPIIEKTAINFGYNYNLKPSFLAALKSHIKRLKELGQASDTKL
ncbi:linoleoyl-CoA desaturase [Lutibacter agarilyticus]|uniref:Linoleoyl-CoA desaturase n=1 Tax=Lutibacter agarilyticus TaxID=1109740 RepID=A0A238YM30_9FLAO|nr:acyl-CoA desaturase [Lutibacter agarilyticus]SNR72177.1 linoleoyl-CoA desaturase [Lutibacter agarilyticus]